MTLIHHISRTLQRRRNISWHAMGYNLIVRAEQPDDWPAVAALTKTNFDTHSNAKLNDALRQQSEHFVALVAQQHKCIVGHVMFSPATITQHPELKIAALAPMVVKDHLQQQGIGSALVRAGLLACQKQGAGAAIVFGPPAYFRRFGFVHYHQLTLPNSALASVNISDDSHVTTKNSLPFYTASDIKSQREPDALMALELIPGYLSGAAGNVQYHAAFANTYNALR